MSERPILFSGEMVRAILEGRKTQTRRVVFPQPSGIRKSPFVSSGLEDIHGWEIKLKYGQPGDQLWVREKWRIVGWHEGSPYLIEYGADGSCLEEPGDSSDLDDNKYGQYGLECADDCIKAGLVEPEDDGDFDLQGKPVPTHWRPSIFMPRWASRITLEIVNIKVQRVQDISEEDAKAEGMLYHDNGLDWWGNKANSWNWNPINQKNPHYCFGMAKFAYGNLWDSLNAKRGFGWDTNPWVWVIEFKVVTK